MESFETSDELYERATDLLAHCEPLSRDKVIRVVTLAAAIAMGSLDEPSSRDVLRSMGRIADGLRRVLREANQ